MQQIEVIKTWEYHQRIIFLTKISNKYQLFYRSSGLAGHGSKGMILPHLLLKSEEVSPDGFGVFMSYGWIPKYYVYSGRFQEYRSKSLSEFPRKMHDYMEYLQGYDVSDAEVETDPRVINNFCVDYIKSQEDYLDWKEL